MIPRGRLLALSAAFGLAMLSPALAESSESGRPNTQGFQVAAGDTHDHAKEHGHDDEAHYEEKTFASVQEAWTFITTKVAEAEKLVSENKIEPVHEISEQLGSAVHTLEEKSDMVADESKAKLAAALKQLDKALDELHHAAEGKDTDATTLNLKKIKGLLPLVQGLYPAGTL